MAKIGLDIKRGSDERNERYLRVPIESLPILYVSREKHECFTVENPYQERSAQKQSVSLDSLHLAQKVAVSVAKLYMGDATGSPSTISP